jgi:hypothetical protein
MRVLQAILASAQISEKGEQLALGGITYPNNAGYLTDINLMLAGLGNYQYNPLVWTILDKTFISVSDNSASNKYYIYVYDHFRNKVSNAIYTGLEAEGANDVHHIASLIGTDGNKLLITETSFHGTSGNWKHSLSGSNYDANNFAAWTDSGINHSTYHQLKRFSDGDIYDVVRTASIAGNFANTDLYKSVDDGVSFSLVHRILDWDSQPDTNRYIPYQSLIYSSDDTIRIWINSLDYTWTGVSTFIGGPRTYYLESADGGTTWRNVGNTFSKDVVATSPLTLAEMNANMLMWDLGTATDIIRANGGCLYNSQPYIVGGSGDLNDSPLTLYYWSGSAWIQKVITCAGHTILGAYGSVGAYALNNSVGIFQYGSDLDLICCELVSGFNQMSRFRSSDNGTTWTFIEQLTNQDYNHAQANI